MPSGSFADLSFWYFFAAQPGQNLLSLLLKTMHLPQYSHRPKFLVSSPASRSMRFVNWPFAVCTLENLKFQHELSKKASGQLQQKNKSIWINPIWWKFKETYGNREIISFNKICLDASGWRWIDKTKTQLGTNFHSIKFMWNGDPSILRIQSA